MFTSRVGEFMVDEIGNVKVEVVVEDDTLAETVIAVVKKTADTRHPGNGRIFVIPVKASIRIRRSRGSRTSPIQTPSGTSYVPL